MKKPGRKYTEEEKKKILDECYDVLVKHDFNSTEASKELGYSRELVCQRKRELKKLGYKMKPPEYTCSGMATNEERLRYYDFTANRSGVKKYD